VQQPPSPARTPAIRSCRSERSLKPLALGVSEAAPLPIFLIGYGAGAGEPKATRASLGTRRAEQLERSEQEEDAHFSNHVCLKERKRTLWFDWTSVKSPSPPSFIRYFTIHFTWTQQPTIREINEVHLAEEVELRAAEDVDEAEATPPFAARCVTGSVGSLPPNQFSESTRGFLTWTGPSAIFTTRLEAYTVNVGRNTRFTVAFTDPFTLKACETTCATEVMNSICARGNHRTGLERPHFGQVLVAKRPHGSLQPKTLVACKYFVRVPWKRDETGSAIIGDRSEGGKNSTLHLRHCNFFTFVTPQDTRCKEDAFRERSKSSRQKLSEMGGSDPTFSASSRPKSFWVAPAHCATHSTVRSDCVEPDQAKFACAH
jgi:hypothetical protein